MVKYDIEVDWHINEYCNFNCIYCFDQTDKKNKYKGYNNVYKIVDGFRNSGLTWLVHVSGGEPLFYPDFMQLCEILSKDHFLSINTNLSHNNIILFTEKIFPERVGFIHCSLHILERERLGLVGDYIDKYNILRKKGFYVFTSYVMFPHLINRFEKDYEYFKKEGIILMPKTYRGDYNMLKRSDARIFRKIRHSFIKNYPKAYSEKQKSLIQKYTENSLVDMNFDDEKTLNIGEIRTIDLTHDITFINGLPSFKGKICLAGKKIVRMNPNGDVFRCHDDNLFLGNLFEGEIELLENNLPCTVNICSCPYQGIRYVLKVD
jgi:sulfatase maturation enzyme AslB (radical SAM superfamily)